MEATHFIEVYNAGVDGFRQTCCHPINYLHTCLGCTASKMYIYTVAVWKIRATDVPIDKRLAKRVGSPEGFCTVEFYQKARRMASDYAKVYEQFKDTLRPVTHLDTREIDSSIYDTSRNIELASIPHVSYEDFLLFQKTFERK